MSGTVDGSMVTIRAAARIERVSPDTIKRRLAAGGYPGAVRLGSKVNSPWLIPVSALSHATGAGTGATAPVQTSRTDASTLGRSQDAREVEDLRRELAVAQERARIYAAINARLLDIIDRGCASAGNAEGVER